METNEVRADGISRRTALKRVGAGAVIAWSAPAILSVDRASAAGSPPCNFTFCVHAGPFFFSCQPTNPNENLCPCKCAGANVQCPAPNPCSINFTCSPVPSC
jgi:hypothetical protein